MDKQIVEEVIDISKYNGNIDFKKIKGTVGVIIRIGYRGYTAGVIKEDMLFQQNIRGCVDNSIPFGFYFMSQAISESEAIAEADYCLNITKDFRPSYPYFHDSEMSGANGNTGRADGLSKAVRTNIAAAFCERIETAGFLTGIYASKSWYSDHLLVQQLQNYNIWVAQYNSKCTYTASDYVMWQYSSKGRIVGIQGNVDMNHCYKLFYGTQVPAIVISTIEAINGIGQYSFKADGNKTITLNGIKTNFKVKEFRCKDGTDQILIDRKLIEILQDMRTYFQKAVSITSAFRSASHNKSVNGATSSFHIIGQAADITVTGVSNQELAAYLEKKGIAGIGLYDYTGGFVHVDTRTTKYYWIQSNKTGTYHSIPTFKLATYIVNGVTVATCRYNDCNDYVRLMQQYLINAGYTSIKDDGIFQSKTENALLLFQKMMFPQNPEQWDKVCGKKTWGKLIA